jgi:hypothetical protein
MKEAKNRFSIRKVVMSNYRVVEKHIDELCEELQPLLKAELAKGNIVSETWKGNWPLNQCLYVMLQFPFKTQVAPLPAGLRFHSINDPHYWKDEIVCDRTNHVLACYFG